MHLPDYISKDPHSGLRRNSSQSGSTLCEILSHENCKVQFSVILDIRENGLCNFSKPKSWQSLIWTEELRRRDSGMRCPVSPDLQVYLQKDLKTREVMLKQCKTRFVRMSVLPELFTEFIRRIHRVHQKDSQSSSDNIRKDLHSPNVLNLTHTSAHYTRY